MLCSLWEGYCLYSRHNVRLCKKRDIPIVPIQVSCSSKGEDTLFMTCQNSALQVNNAIMILFSYLTHLKLDVWQRVHDRRLVGKWVISTKVLMDNFVHCQMKACIRWLASMIILEVNDYYQCCFLMFRSFCEKVKPFVHRQRSRTRWIIFNNTFFLYLAYFEIEEFSFEDNKRLSNKRIILINGYFIYLVYFKVKMCTL